MVKFYIVLLLFATTDLRADQWFCTEQASEKNGSEVRACGVGRGNTEDKARSSAFAGAEAEFNNICRNSSDCINHAVTAEPKRMSCEQNNGKYKCYRLVVFVIGQELPQSQTANYDISSKHTSETIEANAAAQKELIDATFFKELE